MNNCKPEPVLVYSPSTQSQTLGYNASKPVSTTHRMTGRKVHEGLWGNRPSCWSGFRWGNRIPEAVATDGSPSDSPIASQPHRRQPAVPPPGGVDLPEHVLP